MSKDKKRYILLFVILILVVSLVPSVLAISNYDQAVYKIDYNYKEDCCCQKDYPHNTPQHYSDYHANYPLHEKRSYQSENFENRYSSKSYLKNKKGFLGTAVKEYTVEIKNLGETGKYFIVTFNLKDKYGFEKVESVTKYIKTKETRKFVYRDVQFEKNEILRWRYTIDQTY